VARFYCRRRLILRFSSTASTALYPIAAAHLRCYRWFIANTDLHQHRHLCSATTALPWFSHQTVTSCLILPPFGATFFIFGVFADGRRFPARSSSLFLKSGLPYRFGAVWWRSSRCDVPWTWRRRAGWWKALRSVKHFVVVWFLRTQEAGRWRDACSGCAGNLVLYRCFPSSSRGATGGLAALAWRLGWMGLLPTLFSSLSRDGWLRIGSFRTLLGYTLLDHSPWLTKRLHSSFALRSSQFLLVPLLLSPYAACISSFDATGHHNVFPT